MYVAVKLNEIDSDNDRLLHERLGVFQQGTPITSEFNMAGHWWWRSVYLLQKCKFSGCLICHCHEVICPRIMYPVHCFQMSWECYFFTTKHAFKWYFNSRIDGRNRPCKPQVSFFLNSATQRLLTSEKKIIWTSSREVVWHMPWEGQGNEIYKIQTAKHY